MKRTRRLAARGGGRWTAVRTGLALVIASGMAMTGGAAQAPQEADTVRSDTARALPHAGLVVRALRAPVPAALLPYAVTVRRAGDGPPTAGLSLSSRVRAVPGLQIHGRHNEALGDRIVMRGFGARAQFGVRGVQVLVDGIPATMPDGQANLDHLDLSLLDRADVVRGPAAAAYGNAAGGVLLLSTRPPTARGLRQEASATAGADGLRRLRSTTGGGSGARWIVSLARERRDGFRPHGAMDRYQLTGRVDAPLAGGFLRAVAHGTSYDAENPGALTLAQYRDEPHQAQAYNVAQGTGKETRHGQLGLAWERSTVAGRLEAIVYGMARDLRNPIPPAVIDLSRRAAGGRILLRSADGAGAGAAWAVGADWAVQADDRQNYQNTGGAPGALTLDQSERVRNGAVHGQWLVPAAERVDLFLGARYDRVSFSADDRFVSPENPDDSGRRAMDAFSPTAGVRLDLSPALALFGNVSTAFETPTTTELANRPDGAGGFNPELEPQRTVSYEVGGRGAVSPSVRIEASAYRARVTDALIPFEVASAPGRQYFRNAGGAVHRGVELVTELSMAALDVLAAYSRTDATFSSYEVDGRSFEGLAVPGVRPWTVGVVATGRPHGTMTLELDYRATGEMAVDDANEARAPGYQLVALRVAGPRLRRGMWEVEPYAGVDNVLDQAYVASVVPNAFGGRFYEPGPGRALYFGLELALAPGGRQE